VVFSATESDVARIREPRFAKATAVLSGADRVPQVLPEHPAEISATFTPVNVLEGHTESVFASLRRRASIADVKEAFAAARNEVLELRLPTAPAEWIKVHDDPFRPQPRLDRDNGAGMTTTVGRIREDNVLPNGVKYMLVSHNTRMRAAAGAVLVAEYLAVKGYLGE
jgi:aspartate-semialdehyde dehydrogenase